MKCILLTLFMLVYSSAHKIQASALAAIISVEYYDVEKGKAINQSNIEGIFATRSATTHLLTRLLIDSQNIYGCIPFTKPLANGTSWVALISRGNKPGLEACTFEVKITNAVAANASGVIIFNDVGDQLFEMSTDSNILVPSVFVSKSFGEEMKKLLLSNVHVNVSITAGDAIIPPSAFTHVMFITFAFLVLTIIILVWLMFFYCNRVRQLQLQYINERKNIQLAKKGLKLLKLHKIKKDDPSLDPDSDPCSICLENYQPGDTVRILVCHHKFHHSCVDPWLMAHQNCPNCKDNFLKSLNLIDDEDKPVSGADNEAFESNEDQGPEVITGVDNPEQRVDT